MRCSSHAWLFDTQSRDANRGRGAEGGEGPDFESVLALETDCWDVHQAMQLPEPGFVLLDARSPELFAAGDVPGAVNPPHRPINERSLAQYAPGLLLVVYWAGPHGNGADRAAARIARLDRPVKKMIGGVEGWRDEGFSLVTGPQLR